MSNLIEPYIMRYYKLIYKFEKFNLECSTFEI